MTAVVAVMAIMASVCVMRRPQLGAYTSHKHISNDDGTRAKAALEKNRQHETDAPMKNPLMYTLPFRLPMLNCVPYVTTDAQNRNGTPTDIPHSEKDNR